MLEMKRKHAAKDKRKNKSAKEPELGCNYVKSLGLELDLGDRGKLS